jgi:hypothetical protein
VNHVSTKMEFWNRSGGRDHIFVAAHDYGACFHSLVSGSASAHLESFGSYSSCRLLVNFCYLERNYVPMFMRSPLNATRKVSLVIVENYRLKPCSVLVNAGN